MGFAPDLTVGVFVGFDQPRPMGKFQTGGQVAAPIFRDFMMAALQDTPDIPFRIPPDIRLVRVDYKTGRPPSPGSSTVILEAFKPGTDPISQAENGVENAVIGGDQAPPLNGNAQPGASVSEGTGGLY